MSFCFVLFCLLFFLFYFYQLYLHPWWQKLQLYLIWYIMYNYYMCKVAFMITTPSKNFLQVSFFTVPCCIMIISPLDWWITPFLSIHLVLVALVTLVSQTLDINPHYQFWKNKCASRIRNCPYDVLL